MCVKSLTKEIREHWSHIELLQLVAYTKKYSLFSSLIIVASPFKSPNSVAVGSPEIYRKIKLAYQYKHCVCSSTIIKSYTWWYICSIFSCNSMTLGIFKFYDTLTECLPNYLKTVWFIYSVQAVNTCCWCNEPPLLCGNVYTYTMTLSSDHSAEREM